MNTLISIIVPVYKVEDLLARCVDSLLVQTYKELEIILVDDGSPDNSGQICEAYAKRDGRVKVIHKVNGGLSDARNAGMPHAHGSYITFLDSDDWVHETYIETLYNLLRSTDADIAACNFLRTSSENVSLPSTTERIFEFSNEEALEQIIAFGEFHEQMVVAWGKLYKAELFEGITYPVGRIHEDEFTTYKLIDRAKKVSFTTQALLYYWQREDSIMGTGFKLKNKLDHLEAWRERAAFFHAEGKEAFSDKSYRSLFTESLATILTLDEMEDTAGRKAVLEKLEAGRNDLRGSGKWKIKFMYDCALLFPGIVIGAYRTFKNIKK